MKKTLIFFVLILLQTSTAHSRDYSKEEMNCNNGATVAAEVYLCQEMVVENIIKKKHEELKNIIVKRKMSEATVNLENLKNAWNITKKENCELYRNILEARNPKPRQRGIGELVAWGEHMDMQLRGCYSRQNDMEIEQLDAYIHILKKK